VPVVGKVPNRDETPQLDIRYIIEHIGSIMQPDPSTPRFVISLLNLAAGGDRCAQYEAHQVPARGDLVCAYGGVLTAGTPFERQSMWRVESVMWLTASPGSHDHLRWTTHRGLSLDHGCCNQVDLTVWPAEGPHWAETPPWAYQRPEAGEEPENAA
jgi:hypothetical protein